jgi:hypothetical protein
MFESVSSKQSESIKASEEECLRNIIVDYHCSRESFHFLIDDSFYYLYPDIFLGFDVHNTLPTLFYNSPSQFDLFDISSIGHVIVKHKNNKDGFDALSLQSFTRDKDTL